MFLLAIVPMVSAQDVVLNYDYNNITSDVYLDKPTIPEDFYSFITIDLGEGTFEDPALDLNSLQAELSLAVVGGTGEPNLRTFLLPDQVIDLDNDSVAQIYTYPIGVYVDNQLPTLATGQRYNYSITSLVKSNLQNRSTRYLNLRLEDLNHNGIVPNEKQDSGTLYVGSNNDQLLFGSSEQNSVDDYKPHLTITMNHVDPSNITVNPNENVILPQVESSKSLDLEGLERTYLKCTWQINGQGETFIDMNSNMCPGEAKNHTFTGSEDYAVMINYLDIAYNTNTQQWDVVGNGTSGQLDYHYNMILPEPDQSWLNSVWGSIWNNVKGFICGLFPSLGMCS